MKALKLFFIGFLLLSNPVNAQTPSSCVAPQFLLDEYDRDIKNLALKRMHQVNSPDLNSVIIPQTYQDSISEGLAAIFNSGLSEADTVFNIYCVHDNTFPNANDQGAPHMNYETRKELLIQVNLNYAWTSAWQNLNAITGDPTIDGLVTNYSITVENFYNWGIGDYALISTADYLNPEALIQSFEASSGVISGQVNSIIGGAHRMEYDCIGGVKYYDFIYEFNDCFDGCDNRRKWQFKVNPDCSVEFLGATNWGYFQIEPLPAPSNCDIASLSVEENPTLAKVQIYPNPGRDFLKVQVDQPVSELKYLLLDQMGRVVLQGQLINNEDQIDIHHLSSGSYILKLGDQYEVSHKVMKL